ARAGVDRFVLELPRDPRADRPADRALRRVRRQGPRRRQLRLRLRDLRRLWQDRSGGGVEEARRTAPRRRHRRREIYLMIDSSQPISAQASQVKSATRTLDIIEYVVAHDRALVAQEIAIALGIPV